MGVESCKRFVEKGIFRKEFYVWSELAKIGINLIKQMSFKIKSKLVQNLILVFLSVFFLLACF